MRIDGIKLVQGSNISNLTVATGTSFPTGPDEGELFFRSDADSRVKGLYCYINGSWDRISSTESLTVPSGSTLPSVGNAGDLFYLNTNDSSEGLYVFNDSAFTLVSGSGSMMSGAEIISALGYTPANKAGDTITGAIGIGITPITSTSNLQVASPISLLNGNTNILYVNSYHDGSSNRANVAGFANRLYFDNAGAIQFDAALLPAAANGDAISFSTMMKVSPTGVTINKTTLINSSLDVSGTVSGANPTSSTHLTTKLYVDSAISNTVQVAGAGLVKTGSTIDIGTASSSRIVVNADSIDLAASGIDAGTYQQVVVDVYGRVTAGSNSPTFTTQATISGASSAGLYFTEQDQTLPAGRWGLVLDGDALSVRHSTDASIDWASYTTPLTFNSDNSVHIATSTAATSTTTGALRVGGGAGIAGAVYAGSMFTPSLTLTDGDNQLKIMRNSSQYMLIENNSTDLGPYIRSYSDSGAAKYYVFDSTTDTSNTAQSGGSLGYTFRTLGVERLWLGTYSTGVHAAAFSETVPTVYINSTTASTSTSSGSLVVQGGVGIAGGLYVGGTLNVPSLNVSTSGVISVSSASTAFRVTQTGTGEIVRFEDDTNPDNTAFVINASGNVSVGGGNSYGYKVEARAIDYATSQAANGYALRGTSSDTGAGWLSGLFMESNSGGVVSVSLYSPNAVTAGANTTQKAIEINGQSSSQNIRLYSGGGIERARLLSTGQFTVSAGLDAALTMHAAANTPAVQVVGTSNQLSAVLSARSSVDSGGPSFYLAKSRGTGITSDVVQGLVVNGDSLGALSWQASTGTNFIEASNIASWVDGTTSATAMPSRMTFATTPTGSIVPTERMRIDSAGNIGIGTVSPLYKVDISSSTASAGFIGLRVVNSGGDVSDDARLVVSNGTLGTSFIQRSATHATEANAVVISPGGSSPIIFYANNTERARIDSNGLGVGTAASGPYKISSQYNTNGVSGIRHLNQSTGVSAESRILLQNDSTYGGVSYYGSLHSTFSNQLRLWQVAANPIVFVNSGTERARIHTNGFFGVGTASPTTLIHGSVSVQNSATTIRLGNDIDAGYGEFKYIGSAHTTTSRQNAIEIANASTTGPVSILTNSTERLRVDSAGNVGIGYNDPITKIEVAGDVTLRPSKTASTTNNSRLFGGAYTGNLTTMMYQNGSNGFNYLNYGGGTANGEPASMHRFYVGTAGTLAAGTEVIRFDTNGLALFGGTLTATGDAKIQSSNGIRIGGTASSDANTLDYYEEGTFTPVVVGATTAGTGTYTTQTGKYTRIGNRVFITIALTWTAHTGTGAMRISGLPFTIGTINTSFPIYVSDLTFTGSQVMALGVSSGSTIYLRTATSGSTFTDIAIDTAATINIGGNYTV